MLGFAKATGELGENKPTLKEGERLKVVATNGARLPVSCISPLSQATKAQWSSLATLRSRPVGRAHGALNPIVAEGEMLEFLGLVGTSLPLIHSAGAQTAPSPDGENQGLGAWGWQDQSPPRTLLPFLYPCSVVKVVLGTGWQLWHQFDISLAGIVPEALSFPPPPPFGMSLVLQILDSLLGAWPGSAKHVLEFSSMCKTPFGLHVFLLASLQNRKPIIILYLWLSSELVRGVLLFTPLDPSYFLARISFHDLLLLYSSSFGR